MNTKRARGIVKTETEPPPAPRHHYGIWRVILLAATLGMAGCATFTPKESNQFQPAIPNQQFSPRQHATSTNESVRQLRREGYFEIGHIKAEQLTRQCDDTNDQSCKTVTHTQTSQQQALKEAAKHGADVVLFTEVESPRAETRYRRGACTHSHQTQQMVSVPRYSHECRQVGNNQECGNVQSGTDFEMRTVSVCDSWDQIPFHVNTVQSSGTAYRLDKANARKYTRMVDYSKTTAIDDQKSNVGRDQSRDDATFLWGLIGGLIGFYFLVMGI